MEFPEVVEVIKEDSTMQLVLDINEKLQAFEGHFDSVPIIPGVVQIQWVIEFTKRYFSELNSIEVNRMDAIKYQHVIQPNCKISLRVEHKQGKLWFAFESDGKKHSSGKLVIE
ncbi:AMP-binding protein [Aliikangiella coralliicola]|uniref:AMP-binding protein n=1 Tax=Aliikangiella coralliicola TaxID=2592383 RepID=A0A545UEG0_9GAMM|nr:AMP-binding protein [Aliikangiella coralliicola]TQV87861.1 AMP-binding protein [Aliikangiella coralliicola]